MSDKALFSLLTALFLAVLAVWVPLLEAIAWLHRGRSAETPKQTVQPQAETDRVEPVTGSAAQRWVA